MNALIIFYSRTGITRKVAEAVKEELGCECEEIFDTKDRSGAMGYLGAGKDATMKALTELKPILRDPEKYDLLIIGTPVWAFTMSTPVRTYIFEQHQKFKNVAFFCTQGASGDIGTFKEMQKLSHKEPIVKLTLTSKEVSNSDHHDKVKEFCSKINCPII